MEHLGIALGGECLLLFYNTQLQVLAYQFAHIYKKVWIVWVFFQLFQPTTSNLLPSLLNIGKKVLLQVKSEN